MLASAYGKLGCGTTYMALGWCSMEASLFRDHKEPALIVWRPPAILRVVAGLLCAAFLFIASQLAVDSLDSVTDWLALVFAAAVGVASGMYCMSTSLSLTSRRVIAMNFGYKADIPLAEILTMQVGYGGLKIYSREGWSVHSLAVEKSRLSSWLHRETRGDRVIAAIENEISRSRGGHSA